MNPKIFALLTMAFYIVLIIGMFIFNLPIAYTPENSSLSEFIFYHVLFIFFELAIFSILFIYMIETLNIHMLVFNEEIEEKI